MRASVHVLWALLVVAVVASGCVYGPDPNLSFVAIAERAEANDQYAWFCHSQGDGGHHGTEGGPAHGSYAGKKKGPLSRADCLAAAQFFDKATATARRFPTRGAARAHKSRGGGPGLIQAVQFVPGLGTHDMIADISNSGFDPARPMFFQYDGSGDDARLAGLSWFVTQPAGVTTPPEGLPGDNDMWHTHATLCFRPGGVVVGNEISDEECQRRGGSNGGLPGVWMVHAWILPGYENTYDVFSGAFACVRGTGPLTDPNDPCKADRRDPEHGHTPTTTPGATTTPTPTTGHGDHGH